MRTVAVLDVAYLRAMEPGLFVDVVAEQGARIAAVARDGPFGARVPHMRRWTLTDVVAHLGGVHRWATEIVSTRSMSRGHRRGTATGPELIGWFEDGLTKLVATLAASDFSASCPNFSPGSDKTIGFWARRQAHETLVHRWDAEAAAGQITVLDSALATDGIDEMLTVFRRTRGGQPLPGPVVLATTDTGQSWRVSPALVPGRVEISSADARAAGKVAATIAAPAESLLLALWGRIPIQGEAFQVTGQREVAKAFLPGPAPH
jgi:uncharacterized protein (TIGR03083 family)